MAVQDGREDGMRGFRVTPEHSACYVLSEDDHVVGVLAYRRSGWYTHVDLLYVEPSSRRTGVATLMVDAVVQMAEAVGEQVTADAHALDETLVTVLERLGFVENRVSYLYDGARGNA